MIDRIKNRLYRILKKAASDKQERLMNYVDDADNLLSLKAAVMFHDHPLYFNVLRMQPWQRDNLIDRISRQDCFGLSYLGDAKAPTVFEIGAHIGVFARHALHEYKDAEVRAFEPDIENLSLLAENLAPFSGAKAEGYALMDKRDTLDFYTSSFVDWGSSLGVKKEFFEKDDFTKEGITYESAYKVQVLPMDAYVAENPIKGLDFILVTVPGEIEDKVLEGGREIISKFRPIVSLSVYPVNKDKVDAFFDGLGGYVKKPSPYELTKNVSIYVPEERL